MTGNDNASPDSIGIRHSMTEFPPLIPDRGEDSDWDSTLVVHNHFVNVSIVPERRHSGWETVERGWVESKQQQAQAKGLKSQGRASDGPFSTDASNDVLSSIATDASKATAFFAYPQMSIPTPQLEFDFRMRVLLNPQSASISVGDGFKKMSTFSEGTWSGHFGHGLVVVSSTYPA